MLLSRTELAKLFASTFAISTFPNPPEKTARYHEPPAGVSYQDDPTVFGRILEGSLPCSEISETKSTFTFRDRTPRAPLHALVIPKRYIKSVRELDPTTDLELLKEMKQVALETLQAEYPMSYNTNDYILCFHVPPFTSVGHLHLHILAPASEMNFLQRYGRYRSETTWCTSLDTVMGLLSEGKQYV